LPAHEVPQAFADDLKGMLGAFRRRWGLFILGLIPPLAGAAVWLYYAVPLYTATATIMIDSRRPVITSSPEVMPDLDPVSPVVDTQVQLLQSRTIVGSAINALGGESRAAAILDVTAPGSSRNQLIDFLQSNLEVGRIGLTSALSVSYGDSSPTQAALVANAVASAYIKYQRDIKQNAMREANQWLKEHVTELKAEVQAAEAAVDAFRSRSGLLVAKGATSSESDVAGLDVGLTGAQQGLSETQARLSGFREALERSGPAAAAEVVSSPMMQQLRTQYSTLAGQKAQLSPTLGPSHPQMVELTRQLESVQKQMSAEAQRMIGELTNDLAVAGNKVGGLQSIRNRSRTQLAEDNAANLKLVQLQTNAQSLRTMYETMNARLQQISAQQNFDQVNATVVSEAMPPSMPSSPKVKVIAAGAVGASLAFGSLLVLLGQLFDGTVTRPKEFERKTRIPVLGLVPAIRSRDLKMKRRRLSITELIPNKPLSLFAESFRNLRIGVGGILAASEPLVIQFTSGTFAEGKTVSSIAFAQTAAVDGRRVLLIDADVRRRSLTQYLGIKTEAGLMELLLGKVSLQDVIIQSGEQQLPWILPLSSTPGGPHDRFSGPAFNELLQKLKKSFDLIVIDSAPVLAVAEPLTLARHVDAVVVVAKWKSTSIEIVQKTIEEIQRVDGRIVGSLLTHVDLKTLANETYGRGYYPALVQYHSG
jgi:capsular exopolysaccharide synthesis family protein